MTTEQRLTNLEDEFDTVKQLLAAAARYAESANRGLEQQRNNLDDFIAESRLHRAETERRLIALETRFNQFLEQAERDRAESRLHRAEAERRLTALETRFNQFLEQAERDRIETRERLDRLDSQAAIDRQEFRTTTQALIEALRDRFNGNGRQ